MEATLPLRVGFVVGVTPHTWARRWREQRRREPLELTPVAEADALPMLRDLSLDMCLLRAPVERTGLHVVRVYDEQAVVVVPKEHPVTAYDEIDVAELGDEEWLENADPATTVALVAAGHGLAVMPASVARLHRRRDVEHRALLGVEDTQVVLAWLVDRDDEQTQGFVGVVRGRTSRSSRG